MLAFIAFIAFIMYFVVLSFRDPASNHDLVTEDYYQKELKYQEDLDAAKNLEEAGGGMRIEVLEEGIIIRFPEYMEPGEIDGTVSLYRPSNKRLDFKTPIQLSERQLLIPRSSLLDGRWDLRVDWEYQGKPYLFQQKLTY